jgi:hypothetical protein
MKKAFKAVWDVVIAVWWVVINSSVRERALARLDRIQANKRYRNQRNKMDPTKREYKIKNHGAFIKIGR